MGGYLYFADILPGVVKFLKWLIRIPGGDRERGLELLEQASRSDGYARTDTELVLGVIYYLFEGRIRRGAEIITGLSDRHPWHPRLIELRGSTSLLYPESTIDAIAFESRLIERWGERVTGWDELFLHRLRWSRARLLRQAGFYQRSIDELRSIADEAPPHPFWITPRSLLASIDLEVSLGRRDAAAAPCARMRESDFEDRYRDEAKKLCDRQPDQREVAVFAGLGPARQALYGGDLERAAELHRQLVAEHGPGSNLRFFEAELYRLEQRFDEAETAYHEVIDTAGKEGREPLKKISLLRLGEMHIDRRQFAEAKSMYSAAREMEPKATMLGNMIRGRLLYIEQQGMD
jgi:tetratricopeptide (TPR) repeat protein